MNAADIIGHPIVSVQDKGCVDSRDDGDTTIDIHFYTFATAMGRADVVLHCEHNGYYGGWLNGPREVS